MLHHLRRRDAVARVRLSHPDPVYFNAINVTPFIDVMLVLLVVIILSLPLASHKVPLDLLQPGKVRPGPVEPHELAIERSGALRFDGRAVGDAELPALLASMRANPNALLRMNPDPQARYDRFDAVLAAVKGAGITRIGFVGGGPLSD
jgi:biopolymer transport protein ExbD